MFLQDIKSIFKLLWYLLIKYWWILLSILGVILLFIITDGRDKKSNFYDKVKDKIKDVGSKADIEIKKIKVKEVESKQKLEEIKKINNVNERLNKLAKFLKKEFSND